MVANDDSCSESEIFDEAWPDDYLESDADCEDISLESLNLHDPSPAELVPIEILGKIVETLGLRDRCSLSLVNRAFCKAVRASWHVHRLAITSNEDDVRIRSTGEFSRGIVIPSTHLQRQNAGKQMRFKIVVDGQVKHHFSTAEECLNSLAALFSKFEKLHVHLLVLNNAHYILDSSCPFFEFLNNRRFSFAVLELTSGLAGTDWISKDERIGSLVSKATKEVVVIKRNGPVHLLKRPRDSFTTIDSYLEYFSHLYSVVS